MSNTRTTTAALWVCALLAGPLAACSSTTPASSATATIGGRTSQASASASRASATAPSGSTSARRTSTPTSAGCSATKGRMDWPGLRSTAMTPAALRTAERLLAAATSCDVTTLVDLATRDRTRLSYGVATPQEVLALPDEYDSYLKLAALLTRMEPLASTAGGRTSYVWPAVHAKSKASDADWAEAVRAGLITQKEADDMRAQDSGYLGYRLSIGANGEWEFFIAGD